MMEPWIKAGKDIKLHGFKYVIIALYDSHVWVKNYDTGEMDTKSLCYVSRMALPWGDDPEIHWERIPDYVTEFEVGKDKGLYVGGMFIFSDCNFGGDDWAFPNWRDFIGQTFKRPE